MSDLAGTDAVVAVAGYWAVPAAALVGALAFLTASLHAMSGSAVSGRGRLAAATVLVREVARLLRQRRRRTVAADVLLWRFATAGLVPLALLKVTVIPFGRWTLFDSPVGVVWFNAMDVGVWALVWLAGWGPNAVHSLVGGYRFLAQAVGYELPLMFALVAPPIAAGSLRVGEVSAAQDGLWFVVWMPVAFGVYCVGVVAFSVWGPFSVAVGSDLAGGVLAESSGVDRLLFLAGRYLLLVAGAGFAVPMFLGGGAGPILAGWVWVLVKTMLLLAAFVAVGHRVPSLRPDKFVEAAWVVLLPLAVAQDMVVAVVAVGRT
ncbi:MAG: complex I subunit 1 family protein [Nocardioidaceae bacterium]